MASAELVTTSATTTPIASLLPVNGGMNETLDSNATNTNTSPFNTDSELIQIEHVKAKKNKSNLFLIKSYSFIDKTNNKRQINNNKNDIQHKAAAHRHSLQLNNFVNNIDKLVSEQRQRHHESGGGNSTSNINNRSAPSKHEKKLLRHLEKSQSLQESNMCDELEEYKHLLRKQHVVLDCRNNCGTRPVSLPVANVKLAMLSAQDATAAPPTGGVIKRESFLRQSLQSLRRSFSSSKRFTHPRQRIGITSMAGTASNTATLSGSVYTCGTLSEEVTSTESSRVGVVIVLNDGAAAFERSTSSVSTLSYTAADINSMAPLHTHAEAQSDTCLNTRTKQHQQQQEHHQQQQQQQQHQLISSTCSTVHTQQQQQNKLNKSAFCQQLSLPESTECDYGTATTNASTLNFSPNLLTLSAAATNKIDSKSLRQSSNTLNPLINVPSTSSIRSGSSNSSGTAKHEQNTMVAATAQANSSATSSTEKEKKRKEVSSSRVKKFHRHFTQVPKDEKLINYFSCALVSDILLQGHLYITEQHFAFYSNVFGYVTKVVIPTASVTKISKEKTAKIIPNAVGVATADERHVFGSFISREAAFRLMCSVCPPMVPVEILPKAPADIEICEEYSIEDDSSCSISGNESPPQQLANGIAHAAGGIDQSLLRRPFGSSLNIANAKGDRKRASDLPLEGKTNTASSDISPSRNSMPPNLYAATAEDACIRQRLSNDVAAATCTNSSSTNASTPSTSSSPITVVSTAKTKSLHLSKALCNFLNQRASKIRLPSLPTELRLIYIGVMLAVLLSLFSVFLLYRVLDIEAKATLYPFNLRTGKDDDIFHEALRWQKELQTKSTEEAQTILTQNLELIAKVRRSLETLSMLIHDRRTAVDSPDAAVGVNN